jgi:molybdopterin/thiamine biosynthesis adenylyltransferase
LNYRSSRDNSKKQISDSSSKDFPLIEVKEVIRYDMDNDPSSRQRIIEGWDQEKLKEAKVLVAGAGATGNELVKNLLLLGVGTIFVVDFDYVIPANLSKCIFFDKEDAKKRVPKAEALARKAKMFDPYGYINIIPVVRDITKIPYDDKTFKEPDIFVIGLDNIYSRIYLNIASVMNRKPLIDTGMEGFNGYVQVVEPGKTACLNCTLSSFQLNQLYERISCSGNIDENSIPKMPSVITTTSIVAAVAAQETVKIILNSSDQKNHTFQTLSGKILYYCGRTNFIGVFSVERNPSCEVCKDLFNE